ncbi:MAG TPA: adenylate kinase [Blastocatellia bacterium]|nr:adenylate kinase [Blastocatellia bacterium]
MPNIVVLMGPQGAGKGTQAQMLADQMGLPIIATGDILREVARGDTELGDQVREILASGRLVPDEILAQVVSECTSDARCNGGYILDGFPRTPPQARQLERIAQAQGHRIIVVKIDAPTELLYKRLAGRRTCTHCNAIYNIYFKPPAQPGVCDLDGHPLFTRSDDNEESIARRLGLYEEKTRPLLDYYDESGRLYAVDGTGSPDEVHERIAAVIKRPSEGEADANRGVE